MGVCAFHLEHYQEAITNFTNLLAQDSQYRKNAYLFLAISHKKCMAFEEALLVVSIFIFSLQMPFIIFLNILMR